MNCLLCRPYEEAVMQGGNKEHPGLGANGPSLFKATGNNSDRRRSKSAAGSGFTLLEVMIALAIMSGVILTVISSFNYHLGVVNRDREETIAVILARAKLDDPNFMAIDGGKGTFAPDWPDIAWKTVIKPTEFPGVNRLTFTVSWDTERKMVDLVQFLAK